MDRIKPDRPVDWAIDYPEYNYAKEFHVKVLKDAPNIPNGTRTPIPTEREGG